MKEFLVIFESEIDRPQWFCFRARFRSYALRMAASMLRHRVGDHWSNVYSVSVVVSR